MYKDRRKTKKSKAYSALLRRWSEVRILHGSLVSPYPVKTYGNLFLVIIEIGVDCAANVQLFSARHRYFPLKGGGYATPERTVCRPKT